MKRPLKFYQDAWGLYNQLLVLRANNKAIYKCDLAVDAFRIAGEQHKIKLSGCMTNRKSALSYMMDDVKRKVQRPTYVTVDQFNKQNK